MKIPQVDMEEIAARNGVNVEEVKELVASIRKGMKPVQKLFRVKEDDVERCYTVIRHGAGSLNTPHGSFW